MTTAATPMRRRLGKYELVARIGEGGMAEVYLARQFGPRQFQKLVVVKTVRAPLAAHPGLIGMLLEEARIAALVKHPNVVDIYDLGEADGTFFIAMEYLEGESLAQILKMSRPGARLDPFSTARIIADGAAGLHAAHELKNLAGEPMELVHQDVSPGNVIVLYSGQVKLVDFGVAKVRTTTDDGLLKGKTGYLAPELLDGAPADRRSDVFALGIVLWESLTLKRLFGGRSEEEAVAKIRAGAVPAPSRLVPAVPRDLDEVCFRALAKDPAKRYLSAAAMHEDLQQILRHASWSGGSEPIARFMRSTFAARIDARAELLRELAKRGTPRPGTLDRLIAITDQEAEAALAAGAPVVGAHGAARVPHPTPTVGELAPLTEIVAPPRRRRVLLAAIVGGGLIGGVVAAAALGGGAGDSPSPAPAREVAATPPDPQTIAVPVPVPVVAAGSGSAADAAPDADPAAGADPGSGDVADPVPDPAPVIKEPRRDRKPPRDVPATAPPAPKPIPAAATARSLYKDGLQKFVAGDVDAAIAMFEEARRKDRRYAPTYRGLGMAYEKRGDRRRAAKAFETYLSLAPTASDASQIRDRLGKLR